MHLRPCLCLLLAFADDVRGLAKPLVCDDWQPRRISHKVRCDSSLVLFVSARLDFSPGGPRTSSASGSVLGKLVSNLVQTWNLLVCVEMGIRLTSLLLEFEDCSLADK